MPRHSSLRVLPPAVFFACSLLAPLQRAWAETPPTPVDFVRDIQPILAAKCVACHGADEQEGQLRFDARASVLRGGVSGKLFEPGQSKQSLLYERLAGVGDAERMPLDDEPLSEAEIELICRWIDSGAPWPDDVGVKLSFETHWAYAPPQRAALPQSTNRAWVRNPLDAFILKKLEENALAPAPQADEAQLLRRVYLDLIGLPPSVEAVDAYLADASPEKFARVVDRLLASPQYGIRWARPWLDAARYADTNGYQADQFRSIWPYRDWVITAMNADMPFDQFTREQIAGDLLPAATVEQKIATGFHRLTTCNVEAGVDPEENRVNQIIDRVNTTGTVWLGSSIECAQCHNHKYDPFTQTDYYRMFAYFNNTPLEVTGDGVTFEFAGPKMDLPADEAQRRQLESIAARRDQLQQQLEELKTQRLEKLADWEREVQTGKGTAPQSHPLVVVSFHSSGGAEHKVLDDGSVLLSGPVPAKDVYTIVARTNVEGITGFKLETLTDPSLPNNGPGRGDAKRPNFVLYDFRVTASAVEGSGEVATPIGLHSAAADFSQTRWDVSGLIDDDPNTGWAINPQFGKPHWATFLTRDPIASSTDTQFTFHLDQHFGGGRTIGRFRLSALTGSTQSEAIPAEIAQIVAVSADKRSAKQQQKLADYFTGLDPDAKRLQDELAALNKQLADAKPITTLVMVEQSEPRTTAVFKRGNFLDRGRNVSMGTPAALPALTGSDAADRRELAEWLIDGRNPLTARVTVNRWWAEIFGRGIVETLEDFGTQGELPTHPELLDWLAVEFMESGWSMKHVHKLIVTSATYQQSSRVSPQLLRRDPYNKLYARGSRFRLPAETVRDNALAISGLLSHDMQGPPIFPPQPAGIWRHVGRNEPKYETSQGNDRFRRGVYVFWRRSAPYPSFTNFDAPDRASCVVQRPRTNTPLQALTLMNDEAYLEMTLALARRAMAGNEPATVEEQIARLFRLCVARDPRAEELGQLAAVFRAEPERFARAPRDAEALVGKSVSPGVQLPDLAAWFFVANILLNLDETITKG